MLFSKTAIVGLTYSCW